MSKKVVVIGGGTGTYTALMGLKHYPLDLSVIITMTDSGGSNRVIRDEFGMLPTSDIRQAMVALADEKASETLRKLFIYRYERGTGIKGMTFGNLFMAALTDIYGSWDKAIAETCRILSVKGQIIPVTGDHTNLTAKYSNGRQVLGEHFIDEPEKAYADLQIKEIGIFPRAKIHAAAQKAILEADMIVIGPGDLYTSLICNLVIEGLPEAIDKSKAKVVYVLNLMTRYGQTIGYPASKHVGEINRYLGKKHVDVVLVNSDGKIPQKALTWYTKANTAPVVDDLGNGKDYKVIRRDVMSKNIFVKSPGDKLVRSLIRHDSRKLAKAIIEVLDKT